MDGVVVRRGIGLGFDFTLELEWCLVFCRGARCVKYLCVCCTFWFCLLFVCGAELLSAQVCIFNCELFRFGFMSFGLVVGPGSSSSRFLGLCV